MTNCEWFDSKLEAYFCDGLAGEELHRFQGHLASCAECRQQVEALNAIDPLVRGVLHHRLALAQMAVRVNGRPRILRLALTAGSLTAAAVLLLVGMQMFQDSPAPPVAVQPPASENPIEPEVKKDNDQQTTTNLGKPLDGDPVKPAPQPHLDTGVVNGPDFAIISAAGIAANLETYRGRVFLFGLVSPDQKKAVNNLDQIYDAFGSNPGVRILAVARHREDDFRGTKFPLFFNNGSRLLGVHEGGFRLLDAAGKSRLEGSLEDPADVVRIKAEMAQLGIR